VQLVELLLQKAIGIDDEGCIVEFLVVPSRNGPHCVHLVLGALLLDGLEGRRVLKVFRELMHVLLDVGRVADFPQHGHVCSIFAGNGQRFSDVAYVLELVRHASRLQDRQLELLHKIRLKYQT
jgi:hypothetical protein